MSPNDIPLDTPPAEVRRLLDRVVERLDAFLGSLESQPLRPSRPFDPTASWLREPVPESPAELEGLLEFLFEEVVPQSLNPASPGYLAYIPGGGLPSAAAAELIAALVNRYTGLWIAAPAAVEIETQALRWLARLLGLPEGTLGAFTSGASMSTLLALLAARDRALEGATHAGVVYASREVHHSLTKAARIAGIPAANVRLVDVDERWRLRPEHLAETVRKDRDAGLRPFLVCATTGTINFGAVDPLEPIAEVCEREGLWLHIDAAYGGGFRLVPELADRFRGMERADSVAVDPHKSLFLPYGTGVLLVRRLDDLRDSFHAYASYLPSFQDGHERLDFCELTPELTRDWRGLRLWLPLKLHGAAAFRAALAEKRELALRVHDALAAEEDVEIAAPPELSLFAFRQRWPKVDREEANRRNRELLERVLESGRVLLTGTTVDGTFWIRVCVLHLRTHRERVDELTETVRAALAELRRLHR